MRITSDAPVLAVSLGDPAGIGPELIAAAWAERVQHGLAPFFACGGARLLEQAAKSRGLAVPVRLVSHPSEVPAVFQTALPVLAGDDTDFRPGLPDLDGACIALASLGRATDLVIAGEASALVTGPIAKAQLVQAGFTHPGQTEFVASACAIAPEDAVMLLAGPSLRTIPLTVHVALCDVPRLVTTELVCRRTRIAAQGLKRDFGIATPRIAIAALNPHCGEGGQFGDEDERVLAPAIEALRREGIDASGPHSADALFAPHRRGSFDVAICMYHDQALIPIKALDFDSGVNMTLGLPIIRTSPDHGTAFAIAGKGIAHPGAMIAAIRMAGECAARRGAP